MEHTTVKDILSYTGGKLIAGDSGTAVNDISIDSRTVGAGDLFVPLKGARSDAHDYISQAVDNGASAVLSCRIMDPVPGAAFIQVGDTLKALQDIGSAYRKRLAVPVVGVTGSVGKTTTREMTAKALSARYRVCRTTKNYNSDIGLPIAMSRMSADDEIAVLELGISDFGEMELLSRLAEPRAGIITGIGVAHLQQFKTRENIFREKLKITSHMDPDGALVLNGDDSCLREVKDGRRISFGFGKDCDYRAKDTVTEDGGTSFTAICAGDRIRAHIPVIGDHMVRDALSAVAAAAAFEVPAKDAFAALEDFGGFKGRQQIYEVRDFRVIDDTYNASPDSMRAALDVLFRMDAGGKKIAVLADMLELGENEKKFHYEVGQFAAEKSPDMLICIGKFAEDTGKGYADGGGTAPLRCFVDNEEALSFLEKRAEKDDLILFKGSNGMKLFELIEALK